MEIPKPQRYSGGASLYDVLSFERPVYRIGRVRAIELLRLRPGDRVLDIGCGTGLNFPHLRSVIGAEGHIVGIDASESMLAQAQRKTSAGENVDLLHGDAGLVDDLVSQWRFDAVIATYSMSIISAWRSTWDGARRNTRDGGRIAVVDLALPTGIGRLLEPVARFACFAGGVNLDCRPWRLVEDELDDVSVESHRWGHVAVAAGTHRHNAEES